ncbi:MAG: hypothetical protein ACRCT6_11610 [Notoacmeibacter sp.]
MAHTAPKPINRAERMNGRFENLEPVVDADFETVEVLPNPKTKKLAAEKLAMGQKAVVEKSELEINVSNKIGMTVFGKRPNKKRSDDSVAFYGFSACLIALSFWVSGGHSLFQPLDLMATSGIERKNNAAEIADVAWRVVTIGGQSSLHVEGIVRNPGQNTIHSKPVTVAVKHSDGSTKRYLLGQKGWTLGAGQEVVVSGRLDIASSNIASVVIALTE